MLTGNYKVWCSGYEVSIQLPNPLFLFLMAVFAKPLFTLVSSDFVSFTFFSARHIGNELEG